mmetsp:Transcript_19455/g.50193  ORF Transcript_19455/g.50193 Transcript_19455/m.50193 type:complete len:110 (-) Transcript_19455:307-636(-)
MGMLKSQLVPEEVRATVYNIFRVPLNLIVLGVLLNSLSQFQAFAACGTMLAVAALCLWQLGKMHTHGYTVRSGMHTTAEDPAMSALPSRRFEPTQMLDAVDEDGAPRTP